MATSSRQSSLFGVNDWRTIYQTFREADFRSYDYETLRKSFIDYLRSYYPETFNDYIESSEFIALLDVMAFMGQGLAFRNDLNARENFIDTAERRDSVIKLANLVSYTPKRNLAAQGYIKVVGVSTTENITDLNGINLSNLPVLWNDPANSYWLEQFNTIINAALINTQKIGRPGNVADILGVTTAEYAINIPQNSLPIAPFGSTIDGINMKFELTSVTSIGEDYVYELPPAPSGKFNMLYRNDKLGYGSPNTGFFFYFKQGSLQTYDFSLQQQISNQVVDIGTLQGVNNTDTWLYQLNANNNSKILWEKVDNVYADAYLQTESSNREIFQVNSRANDQVSYVFGDGVFSKIPVGTFRAYVRAGNALSYTIDPSEMQGVTVAFTYVSRLNRAETITFQLQLTSPISNAQERESLAEIKVRAPTRYYTQNRMVNGEDYNNFPYTLYSSIIKSKAVNRSSIGVSKNLDLLDPTGKYSSTNSFGSDGAIWQDMADGNILLNINNTSDIISFLTNTLSAQLASTRAIQYYLAQSYNSSWYSRFSPPSTTYWQTSSVDANSETGYFYTITGNLNVPAQIGPVSTTNLKYITVGAMVQMQAPSGYYFDTNNRLVQGTATAPPGTSNTVWTTVLNVIADGTNEGQGTFPNGSGPVTLNGYIPSGVTIVSIIPVFDNSLPVEIIQECISRMELQQDFALRFNNSLLITESRWTITSVDAANTFVVFTSYGNNRYIITYKSLAYYYGSVADTRFTLSPNELVYDPFSGKILQDYINVLSTNTAPGSTTAALGRDYKVNILGQTVESDGYINDYEVEVAATDVNNRAIITDPDFFKTITGYEIGVDNNFYFVFFEQLQDALNLTRYQLISSENIAYQYETKTIIETVKYDYPEGQLFYAYDENKFYVTQQDPTVITPNYLVIEQSQYSMSPGRQGFSFQYRHNSNNTTRIDPATTNIIDLYVVTQAYYTAYQNWIQDVTNTVAEPDRPTINELSQAYGQVQDYKMLSDSVILNSVMFKPLFGAKAAPALRATIKVIKSSSTNASDSEIRSAVLSAMNSYFNINNWNFGDTFYFSELSAYLHSECGELISSAVLVPNDPTKQFGDLYEIKCMPYEIFVNGATAADVLVIPALTPAQLQVR